MQKDSSATEYFVQPSIKRTSVLYEVDRKQDSVCLVYSDTDEEDYSADTTEELNNRTELKVGEWFGNELLRIFDV